MGVNNLIFFSYNLDRCFLCVCALNGMELISYYVA